MKTKLLRRVKVQQGILLYPIKKDMIVPFTDHLIVQALYGAKVQADLIASTTGLKELIRDLTKEAKVNGYVTMFGGRRVQIRHAHAVLNSQLQGMGAEAMKHYLVFYHELAKERNLVHGYHFKQQACIYDEVDCIARIDKARELKDILQETYAKVSDYLGMKCTYTGEVLVGGISINKKTNKPIPNNWWGCH